MLCGGSFNQKEGGQILQTECVRLRGLRTKFDADRYASTSEDSVARLVNESTANMFKGGESEESTLVPVFERRSFIDDIAFGRATFDDCLSTLDRLLTRFTECRISVSFTKSIFVQRRVDFLSHEVSVEGLRASSTKMASIAKLPFRLQRRDASLPGSIELLQPFQPRLRSFDPNLLHARLPRTHRGFVVSFDGSTKTKKHGGYGSRSWIVWRLPDWDITIAASSVFESTTVNIAEYTGMNNGVKAAIAVGAEVLVIVGDSRLPIQQSLGVIACRKESLMALLNRHKERTARCRKVKYLHVKREYNTAADSLASETLEAKLSQEVRDDDRKVELKALNRIPEAIYEALTEESERNLAKEQPNEDSVDSSNAKLQPAGSNEASTDERKQGTDPGQSTKISRDTTNTGATPKGVTTTKTRTRANNRSARKSSFQNGRIRKTFVCFADICQRDVSVLTRRQNKTQENRVRFRESGTDIAEAETLNEASDEVSNESSLPTTPATAYLLHRPRKTLTQFQSRKRDADESPWLKTRS
ncbi:unnamed protein product [Phytophthora lilii]|uniref:Unnamed protein product n=1 Tax=Phytophthora lilii TaxID=2077276 RepID=A0A9W6WX60_9STRA|nr:unnamed protein product [Phytophthora lilii]